ncbi:hypothetical protein CS8_048240 [Cupriavidus sp. 8B]
MQVGEKQIDMHSAYIENLDKFVFKGPAMARGMPDFSGKLSKEDVEKIQAFIQGTADSIRPKAVADSAR